MDEEGATAGPLELLRRANEAVNKRDLDALMAVYAHDAVWDGSPMGIGSFEGLAAVRGFLADWLASYEEWELHAVEVQDHGNGVAFVVYIQKGRPVGSSGEVQLRYAAIIECEDGKIERRTNYTDIDQARAAAERLAQERGRS